MIVDAHMHLWDTIDGRIGDDPLIPLDNGKVKFGDKVWTMMPPGFTDSRCTAERAIAYFDDAGVEVGVVVQEYMDGNQNVYLLDVMKRYPDRFFMHALINYYDTDNCLTEWKAARKQGFRGLKLPALRLAQATPRLYLNDPRLMKLWGELEKEGCILAVDLALGDEQVKEMTDVAKGFPSLPVVLGHFAMVNCPNWFPQLRLAHLPNVYIESGGICWLFRYEGLDFPDAQEAIRIATLEVGADKLMWGSDLPRTMVDFTYRQLLDFVREGCPFFTDEEKAAFLGGNAARVYGLKTDVPKREPLPLITA